MNKLGFIAMTMLACCLLVTPLASAQGQKTSKAEAGSAEEQIKALQAQLIQAILKSDASFYQKYFAEDASLSTATALRTVKLRRLRL